MGVITLKISDEIEEKLRRKVGRDKGAARGAISSSVEEALEVWLKKEPESERHAQEKGPFSKIAQRSYIAMKAENLNEPFAQADDIESLATKIRERGIDPRSVIIESVPPLPLTRKMGLRVSGRKKILN